MEKQQKKVPHKLCKNKRFKKNIYIFYSKHISLKTTTSKKISLSLSKYNFQLLKKVYSSLRCIAYYWVNNSTSKKKTKTTYRRSYVNLISLSNISIKLFLLRKYILHRNSKRRFLIDFYIRKQY